MGLSLQSVALYHPDVDLSRRLPSGIDPLSNYIKVLHASVEQEHKRSPFPVPALALIVALAPPDRRDFWCMSPCDTPTTWEKLRRELDRISRPRVVEGPLAFAILLNLGKDFPTSEGPPFPKEWVNAAKTFDGAVSLDQLLEKLLL